METIISYLDNMFSRLPKTPELEQVKQDLLVNMQDKYEALIREGSTENEAIGIVIAEFGNIDEIIEELGYQQSQPEQGLPRFTDQEIEQFIFENRKAGKKIGLGVSMIIIGVALFIFMNLYVGGQMILGLPTGLTDVLGLIPLFILLTVAIGLFIYTGSRLDQYKKFANDFELTPAQRHRLETSQQVFAKVYTTAIIIGVALCVLAIPTLIVFSTLLGGTYSQLGTVFLLMMVAIAVYIFIVYGKQKEAYDKLLKTDAFAERQESGEHDRIIGAVAALVWPLAIVIFLISGLVYQQWHINWIIFPVTGLLFGGFSGMYHTLKR
ncbi:permease prefix domain 1-containing protein [Amphibacillus jilinensis]|uniref:permease prefix domain 1-containing protein n=1 Tax=Amphibacillus jilinensis TaxID=1216008 RepID=UPI0002EA3222|nr:permease prefix domain 1-containing protein [Amphibacillus jilinensis]